MAKQPCTDCAEPVSSLAMQCMHCGKRTALGQVDELFWIQLFLIMFGLALGFGAI